MILILLQQTGDSCIYCLSSYCGNFVLLVSTSVFCKYFFVITMQTLRHHSIQIESEGSVLVDTEIKMISSYLDKKKL